jgi:transglutaminase-like putative cysteine protease
MNSPESQLPDQLKEHECARVGRDPVGLGIGTRRALTIPARYPRGYPTRAIWGRRRKGMSRIRISHKTAYRYSKPVTFGIHRLVIRPREGHDVHVETLSLGVVPAAAVGWHRDIFGNSIALASFSEPADFLEFSSVAVVSRRDHVSHHLLDVLPVRFPVEYSGMEGPVALGYLEPVYREEWDELQDWAARTFRPNQGDDAVHLAHEINRWIFQSIRYQRREDRGVQRPLETLRLGSGSCRDMATLLLEAARSLRLASRFASGYLDGAASRAGQAFTHAWTEIYFPEHGWFGCDPSLGEGTSDKHIVCGVSSHPRGVMPVTGSYSGPISSYLGMDVSVSIEPVESLG